MTERWRLFLRGWAYQMQATWDQWRKPHGKRQPFRLAWQLGACGRYVIYGQHYGAREPISGLSPPRDTGDG